MSLLDRIRTARFTNGDPSNNGFTYKDDPGYRASGTSQPPAQADLYANALAIIAAFIWNDAAEEPSWYVKPPEGNDGSERDLTPGERACQELIDAPNPILTWEELIGRIAASIRILGRAFVLKVQPNGGQTTSLWYISAFDLYWDEARWKYIRTGMKMSAHAQEETGWKSEYDREEIIEFRRMPAERSPYGVEYPLAAAAPYIDVERQVARRAAKQAQHFGSGSFVSPDNANADNPMIDEQLSQLDSAMERLFSTDDWDAGATYLPFPVRVSQLGWPLRDLLGNEWIMKTPEARAGGLFGIPPILMFTALGLQSGTYSNAQQFRRDFAERSVVPTLNNISKRLTRFLLREFSPESEIVYRKEEISALFETPVERSQRLETYARNGWLTLDQILEELGHEPLPNGQGDIRQVPAGLLWVPTDELVGATEAADKSDEEMGDEEPDDSEPDDLPFDDDDEEDDDPLDDTG